ncbi:NAD(P)-dependent oxidoreductase [Altererythrobacter sp. CC-YST694]|uniref:NAD-dependent epimerase/dehydratase family protein n=1 Tax=Altererythrobacter sp. CC-YST694 TaxID=2755038 RepID=UPI001D03199C|nr:NAD(P)-dependent oxidoreductase [Altererythrobacter sp. CC-YST694]MCB5426301.1 NAD(P)-dependent oxidoreductase [Altererythrobacter sp. CC-YST694]
MTIAITGATGFVGQAILDEAARQGIAVHALTRREQPVRKGVKWVQGDLADRRALATLVKGVEAVIHVAGVVNSPDAAGFEAGNVEGTLAVVEAAKQVDVQRFVQVSSLAAREPKLSAYGASKFRAEKIVKASALDWTIVRPPAIYGPRDREMFELFRAARWGILPVPADGGASMIHVADLARLLFALVPSGDDVGHRIFEPDDGRKGGWPHKEMARAIGEAMGRRVLAPGLSKPMLLRAAALDARFRKEKAKLTIDRVNYMSHPDWVCAKGKAPPKSRWAPLIDTREGLKATAAWYRENKWL